MKEKQSKVNKSKKRWTRKRQATISLIAGIAQTIAGSTMTFATGEEAGEGFADTVSALDALKTGLFSIIAGVGIILIGKNIMELSTAFQQQDSASMNNAIKGLIAGGLMAAVGTIVTALGFA